MIKTPLIGKTLTGKAYSGKVGIGYGNRFIGHKFSRKDAKRAVEAACQFNY